MNKEIKIKVEGKTVIVSRANYVKAKTKQLQEFGYETLTEKNVEDQIEAIKAKKKFGEGLTVIGMFMQDELICD